MKYYKETSLEVEWLCETKQSWTMKMKLYQKLIGGKKIKNKNDMSRL